MDIEESARRLGAIRWVESTLFEVLGGAAPRCPTPDVTVMVATHARHAAWRAEQLRDRLDIGQHLTVAIGDGRNDIEMLGWAGRGVAMGQAPKEVIAVADEVTASVYDDGAAHVLRSLL